MVLTYGSIWGSESAPFSSTQTHFGPEQGHEISPSVLQLILASRLSQVLHESVCQVCQIQIQALYDYLRFT